MSLKTFHLFFVTVSTLFGAAFAAWCLRQFRLDQNAAHLVWAAVSVVGSAALVYYGTRFLHKMRGVRLS